MLEENIDSSLYDYPFQQILTAKFNQDPVERFFGIVRAIDGHPTCTPWLHLFRILSLYNSSTMDVNGENVDNEEKYCLLVEYKDCLLKRFKKDNAAAKNLRESLKDSLLEELRMLFVEDIEYEPAEIGVNEENSNPEVNEILSDEIVESIHNDAYVAEDEEVNFVEKNLDTMVFGGTKNQGMYDVVGYVLYSRCRHILKCQDYKSLLETEQH
ncbi:Uncharacterized protein APZ42_011183 [Daphnia magna]|uniref:Uncharacterized protein n=1 Tax=Daphnia magna TaxID=35525 RepID=A0A162T1J1_9CRUS|nr:Uncharacterized protein APZ42_011183 [Daphnia magna]